MGFNEQELARIAARMRMDILKMITLAGSGHPGGSLSATDIMATLYFGNVLRYRSDEPSWPGRDRLILSKGHVAPVLYAALAHAGYFELPELATLRKLGSRLQGHPDHRLLPGVEMSTGSLGQGLSIGCGVAYGLRASAHGLDPYDAGTAVTGDDAGTNSSKGAADNSASDQKVYVVLGDGELQEGQVWEAAMFASHQKLNNLIAIVDNNDLQIDGHLNEVVSLGSIAAKFAAFGFATQEVDGHNYRALKAAFDQAQQEPSRPSVIIAKTIKGKGVSYMENQAGWHGKAPSDELCDLGIQEIEASLSNLDSQDLDVAARGELW